MTDQLTCTAAQDLAPDLALGLLPGAERARLLAHLAGCPSCEALVADLADLADSLLLLAPGADPPPGFESAVLARLDAESSSRSPAPSGAGPGSPTPIGPASDPRGPGADPRGSAPDARGAGSDARGPGSDPRGPASDPRGPGSDPRGPGSYPGRRASGPFDPASGRTIGRARRPRRVVLMALAAAVVLLGATGAGIVLADRQSDYAPVHVVQTAALRSAPLVGSKGQAWGEAFLFHGTTSWVMVTMRWDVPDGTYNVVVDRRAGSPEWLANLRLAGGEGSVGTTLVDAPDVTAVRVLDADGHPVCEARFS